MVNVAFKLSTDTELRKLIYICCLFMNPKSFNHQNKINGSADLIRIVSYIKFWIKTDKIWWISNSIRILQTGSQVIQSCSVSQFPSSYECKWDQQFNPFSVSMSLSKSRERKVGQGPCSNDLIMWHTYRQTGIHTYRKWLLNVLSDVKIKNMV